MVGRIFSLIFSIYLIVCILFKPYEGLWILDFWSSLGFSFLTWYQSIILNMVLEFFIHGIRAVGEEKLLLILNMILELFILNRIPHWLGGEWNTLNPTLVGRRMKHLLQLCWNLLLINAFLKTWEKVQRTICGRGASVPLLRIIQINCIILKIVISIDGLRSTSWFGLVRMCRWSNSWGYFCFLIFSLIFLSFFLLK